MAPFSDVFCWQLVERLVLQDPQSGEYHQIWFDDVRSLGIKYRLARDWHLLGVGVWQADSLDYSDTAEKRAYVHDMWNALPDCHWHTHARTHARTRLTALFPGLPRWAGTRKVKSMWILLKQETLSGSGISWAICKSAPRSRQITTPAPHHSVFLQARCPSWRPTNSVKALTVELSVRQFEFHKLV